VHARAGRAQIQSSWIKTRAETPHTTVAMWPQGTSQAQPHRLAQHQVPGQHVGSRMQPAAALRAHGPGGLCGATDAGSNSNGVENAEHTGRLSDAGTPRILTSVRQIPTSRGTVVGACDTGATTRTDHRCCNNYYYNNNFCLCHRRKCLDREWTA
jgi:hypothetical protein